MMISIDIIGFRNVGINSVVIYKVLTTENNSISYYIIQENDFSPCTYYKIENSDYKINKLITELKNTGSIIRFNNQTNKYELSGYKVYDITSDNREKRKFIIDVFDTNPINEEITFNDFEQNNIIHITYDEYFQIYEGDGFPVV